MPRLTALTLSLTLILAACHLKPKQPPTVRLFPNSVGMKMMRIEPGSFMMGSARGGSADERPVHRVVLSKPFYMATTEVTNKQYELYDPAHKERLRGGRGLSRTDDEPALFVSWEEATAYCAWLSKREGRPYRLPTEAEWEYACRAGTTTDFSTGDALPKPYQKDQAPNDEPRPAFLRAGDTPPNAWGLCDMHGNAEEWCRDWYGPYAALNQVNPSGPARGVFKVTRGGSHNTPVEYLRSANRMGALPGDRSWMIGFRVVMGEAPESPPTPPAAPKRWEEAVSQRRWPWRVTPAMARPLFEGPIPFVRPPASPGAVPFYKRNLCPSLTWCPNGDLLAIWASAPSEASRELTILASRLRAGAIEWEEPDEFFKAPDRNMSGAALFNDGHGTLYHFNGIGAAGGWANLALALRTSDDNGASWSAPRLIAPGHRHRHQAVSGTRLTREGYLLQPCDAAPGEQGGTVLMISPDLGETWSESGLGMAQPVFQEGQSGGWIAGIHAAVEQLADGRLMALGRGDEIDGKMPLSLSDNMGTTWSYSASPFPPIGAGQRAVLMRLREGPLLAVSFTDKDPAKAEGLLVRDERKDERRLYGMFTALSYDEGKTWADIKPVVADGPPRKLDGGGWTGEFTMDAAHAEPKGDLAATQTPDGMIHLVSSGLYYRFNFAWLREPMPAME